MKELYLIPKHLYGITKPSSTVKKVRDDVKCGNVNNCSIKRAKPGKSKLQKCITSKRISGDRKRRNRRIPKIGERWHTIIPPPTPPRPALKIQNMYSNSNNNIIRKKKINPNIYNRLNIKIGGKEMTRAKLILKHFENSEDVRWNEDGDLYSPINAYNIVDIIRDLVYKTANPKMSLQKLADVKYIVNVSSLPLHYINNTIFLNYMNGEEEEEVRKGGSTVENKMKKKKNPLCSWVCY